jgi:hypothetical protein
VEIFWDRSTCMDNMKVEKADERRRVWTIWGGQYGHWVLKGGQLTYIYLLTYFNIYTYLILIYIYLFNL